MMTREEIIQRALLTLEEIVKIQRMTAGPVKGSFARFIEAVQEDFLAKLLDLKQPCPECKGRGWSMPKLQGHTSEYITHYGPTYYNCPTCNGSGLSDLPVVGILKAHQAFPVNIKEHLDAAPDYLKETVVESPRDLYLKYLGGYEAQHDMLKAGFKAMEE